MMRGGEKTCMTLTSRRNIVLSRVKAIGRVQRQGICIRKKHVRKKRSERIVADISAAVAVVMDSTEGAAGARAGNACDGGIGAATASATVALEDVDANDENKESGAGDEPTAAATAAAAAASEGCTD